MSPTADLCTGAPAPSLTEAFKDAMASLCSPVTIVTAMDGLRPCGVTVSAFASLSLEPPMVTVALNRRSSILPAVAAGSRLGVCVLGADDQDLALTFATSGVDRFAHVPWRIDQGAPRLTDAPCWIVCDVARAVGGGDHVIVLGQVVSVERRPADTLAYQNRSFGIHTPLPSSRAPGGGRGPRAPHALTRG